MAVRYTGGVAVEPALFRVEGEVKEFSRGAGQTATEATDLTS
jgi:hypothetical protein